MNLLNNFKIGSFAIYEETLYLALEKKNIQSNFVILKVDNFRGHGNGKIKVNLWREIEAPVNYDIQISNIILIKDSLFLTAISESSEEKQLSLIHI